MDLHPGEEVVFEGHPSWRALLAYYAGGLGIALVAGVALWLISGAGLGVLAFVVVLAGVLLIGFVRRIATVYMISTQRLWIRRGILSKHVQQTRIDRVQNVNTEQRFIERIMRVGTVDFDTAGTDDSDFRFVGVSSPSQVAEAVDRAQREQAAGRGGAIT
jgi:uncharacterized membrane protein YdbT with pleckstrin-like domain